ncbi:MAG: hypothetical protein H6Q23_568, partial [Bacteroidetes bacterium]|nr:hypothetical protein [Bacteroidota bacterium]
QISNTVLNNLNVPQLTLHLNMISKNNDQTSPYFKE